MSNSRLFRIISFFVIATTISNLFRFETFAFGKMLNEHPFWIKIASVPLQSISVCLGGLLGLFWLRKKRRAYHTLFGKSMKWTIIMALFPIALLSAIGIENSHNFNPHMLGLAIGSILMVYCVFEEYGWRGYLEDELRKEKEWQRVLIIAILWYAWHLPFIDNHDLLSNLKFFGFILLGSWGIGRIIQSTRSILASACFHMLYSILILQIKDEVYLRLDNKLWIIGICIIAYIIILNHLKKKTDIEIGE